MNWLTLARSEVIVDLGQIPTRERNALRNAVRRGEISGGIGGPFPKPKHCYGPLGTDYAVDRKRQIREILNSPF